MQSSPVFVAQSQRAALDYLVASTDNEKDGFSWFKKFITDPARKHKQKTGHIILKDWHYKGFTGQQLAGIKVGANKTHWLLWASGDEANEAFPFVAPKAKKVARLDLQVTVCYEEPIPGSIQRYYLKAKDNAKSNRKYTYYQNSTGGETLYVGSLKSAQFGRIYYKDAEQNSGTVGKVVRYEVVLRDKYSTAMRDAMVRHEPAQQAERISGYVMEWFRRRGIKPVYDSNLPKYEIEVSKQLISDDRRLNWLRSQVRPTILELLERGYQKELQTVLGIEIGQLLTQANFLPDDQST